MQRAVWQLRNKRLTGILGTVPLIVGNINMTAIPTMPPWPYVHLVLRPNGQGWQGFQESFVTVYDVTKSAWTHES